MIRMHLSVAQKRGSLTLPHAFRTHLAWQEGRPILMQQQEVDSWWSWIVPDAHTLFARYHDRCLADPPLSLPTTLGRLVRPEWLWACQQQPTSSWTEHWQAWSTGIQSHRIDSLVLSAWTQDIATWLPSLTRAEHSRYLQALVAWPGLLWPTRLRWLTALTIWGTATDLTWLDAVWQADITLADAPTADSPS